MKKVGLIGWRGMVGSVLMNRMTEENDFKHFTPTFFSTSQAGQKAPAIGGTDNGILQDAADIAALKEQEIIVTCQGGGYTSEM